MFWHQFTFFFVTKSCDFVTYLFTLFRASMFFVFYFLCGAPDGNRCFKHWNGPDQCPDQCPDHCLDISLNLLKRTLHYLWFLRDYHVPTVSCSRWQERKIYCNENMPFTHKKNPFSHKYFKHIIDKSNFLKFLCAFLVNYLIFVWFWHNTFYQLYFVWKTYRLIYKCLIILSIWTNSYNKIDFCIWQ